jgi:hypothetical protein
VERYRLARRIAHREQPGALYACQSKAAAQLSRELPIVPSDGDDGPMMSCRVHPYDGQQLFDE